MVKSIVSGSRAHYVTAISPAYLKVIGCHATEIVDAHWLLGINGRPLSDNDRTMSIFGFITIIANLSLASYITSSIVR